MEKYSRKKGRMQTAYMPGAIFTASIRWCCHLDGLSTPNQSQWLKKRISGLHRQEKYYSDFWNTQLLRLIFNNSKTIAAILANQYCNKSDDVERSMKRKHHLMLWIGQKPLTRLTTRSILQRKTPGSKPLRTVTDRILQKRRVVTCNNILKGGLGHMTLNLSLHGKSAVGKLSMQSCFDGSI